MNLIENIIDFLRKPNEETEGKSPEGTCPVCWGIRNMMPDTPVVQGQTNRRQ